jgi:alkylation response protein AidB-like acyl-CoA dehydrogenase
MTAAAAALTEQSENHLDRVARVADAIRDASDEIDETRRLPKALLKQMHGEKLFRMLLPEVYGGLEMEPQLFFQMTSAVAECDGSVGWVVCQGNGCSTSAAYVPPETAMEIWGKDPAGVLAWGPGRVTSSSRGAGSSQAGSGIRPGSAAASTCRSRMAARIPARCCSRRIRPS